MSLYGWGLIHNMTGILIRRGGRLGHRETQREDHVKTQGEGGHLQAEKKGLQKNPTLPIPDS